MADIERKTYQGIILNNGLAVSKTKETPSVKISVRIEACPEDSNDTAIGSIMYGDLWLTFATMERTIKTLRETFKWQGKDIQDLNEPILAGVKVDVVVDWDDSFDGKARPNIVFWNRRKGGVKSLDPADLESLVSDVQPMLNKVLQDNGSPTPPSTPDVPIVQPNSSPPLSTHTAESPLPQDDLPF